MDIKTFFSDDFKNTISNSTTDQYYKNLDEETEWLKALAYCYFNKDNNDLSDELNKLIDEMFRFGREDNASSMLDDANYKYFFSYCEKVLLSLSENNTRSLFYYAMLYLDPRDEYKDLAKNRKNLEIAAKLGDTYATILLAYFGYVGYNCETADKSSIEILLKEENNGCELASIYITMINFDLKKWDEGIDRLNKILANKLSRHTHIAKEILADYYYNNDQKDKAIDIFKEAVALNGNFACEKLGLINIYTLSEGNEAIIAEGIELLEKAYKKGKRGSAYYLGRYFMNDAKVPDQQKAIEWFTRGADYNDSGSQYELGRCYLYIEDIKNTTLALELLNKAAKNGSSDAKYEIAAQKIIGNIIEKDIESGLKILTELFENGNYYAATRIGNYYESGLINGENDYAKALEYFTMAAEKGELSGIEMLGSYYRNGTVSDPDPEKALLWIQKGVELNSNYSRIELALCYENGFGVDNDLTKAKEQLQIAAPHDAYGSYRLGLYEEYGHGEEINLEKAFTCYKTSADMGYAQGMYKTAMAYRNGAGVIESPQLTFEYFEKGANANDMDCLTELGLLYENGYGVEENKQKAFEAMQKAADAGVPYAEYRLGMYYYYGYVEADIEKGLEWFEKAHKNELAVASLQLGDHNLYKRSENANNELAINYYNAAKEQDYVSEGLGLCYEYGIGVEVDEEQAFKYYNIAAQDDYVDAQYRLGLCYLNGEGVAQDYESAFNWISKASDKENVAAQYTMGMMIMDGKGVEQNPKAGFEFLMKAAEEDNSNAQYEVGNCYLTGKGVEMNETKAQNWYSKASENGHEKAKRLIGGGSRRRR